MHCIQILPSALDMNALCAASAQPATAAGNAVPPVALPPVLLSRQHQQAQTYPSGHEQTLGLMSSWHVSKVGPQASQRATGHLHGNTMTVITQDGGGCTNGPAPQ